MAMEVARFRFVTRLTTPVAPRRPLQPHHSLHPLLLLPLLHQVRYPPRFMFVTVALFLMGLSSHVLGQDCGNPPTVARSIQTFHNESMGNGTLATVLYRCHSGNKVPSPGFISASCNQSEVWDLDDVSAVWKDCTRSPLSLGCRAMDVSNLTKVDVSLHDTPSENHAKCTHTCRDQNYLYFARQGSQCYCFQSLVQLDPPTVVDTDCDGYCHDNKSFCGRYPGLFSVYKTLHSDVSIKDRHDLYTPLKPMHTSVNCVEFCKAKSSPIAFYVQIEKVCYCLNENPTYTAVFNEKQETNNTGTLEYTEESTVNAPSCQDLFQNGVFYHGNYILSGGRNETCTFYDNSAICGPDWVAYDNGCYHFNEDMENASCHYQSCKSHDSLLASIGDEDEMTFIKMAIGTMSSYMPRTSGYLVGLVDISNLFSYMWADETQLAYRPFKLGFPNNISNACVMVEMDAPVVTNVNCDETRITAICEKRSSTPGCATLKAGSALPPPTITSDNMVTALCFETCRSNGRAFSITDGPNCYCQDDMTSFQLVSWDQCDVQCSIHPFQMCGGNDGSVFITHEEGQPYRETCDLMILEGMVTNVTLQTSAGTQIVNCNKRAGEKCPLSWLDINGMCYRFFPEYNANATLTCISMGGYLSVFESSEEKADVINTLSGIDSFVGENETWAMGLYFHRPFSSRARHTNGAWVPPSLQTYAPTAGDFCSVFRFPSGAQLSEGGSCGLNPFICEKSSDYLGCYNVTETHKAAAVVSGYPEMTVRLCMEACKPTEKPYAGLFGARTCLCVEQLDVPYDTKCTELCASMQSCGSYEDEYMSVYRIDYTFNASSCSDLWDQGVLLNGNYTLGSGGQNTWCGMKNSTFLAEYAEDVADQDYISYTTHRFGDGDHVISMDIWPTLNESASGIQLCKEIYDPVSIVAPTTNPMVQSLITQVLQWSLDSSTSTPAVIGAVDPFGMGSYTWSNGDLFRPWLYNASDDVIYRFNETRSGYLVMDYTGEVGVRDVSETAVYHVACARDITYMGCYQSPNLTEFTSLAPVKDYQSISVSLCRQVCQAMQATHFLISTRSCACHNALSLSNKVMSNLEQVPSNDTACFLECPAHPFQFCGDPPYFRYHQIEAEEEPTSCEELYDNFVVYNATFVVNGTHRRCGLDDGTVSCPPGFISRDDRCYAFQRREDISQADAASQCFQRASFLASPTTDAEIENMALLIGEFTRLRGAQLWLLGYYSIFQPGYWSSSLGYMLHYNHSLASSLDRDEDRKCVALNTTSKTLVSVSCHEKLPFVCESNSPYLGCAELDLDNATSSLELSEVMTLQQCVSFCYGHVENLTIVAIRQTTCSCLTSTDVIPTLSRDNCATQTKCPSQSNQMCGDVDAAPPGELSVIPLYSAVYDIAQMPKEFLVHTCDDLFAFGVFLPALYRTAKNGSDVEDVEWVRCFMYSSKSNYILIYDDSVQIETSASEVEYVGADVTLQVYDFKGWRGNGTASSPAFIHVTLPQYYVLEGLILIDPSPGNQQVLDMSVSLDDIYYTQLDTITLEPSRTITWHYLPVPMLLRHFRLSFNQTDHPRLSMELVGYIYSQHNFHYSYLGCHLLDNVTSSTSPVDVLDVLTCRRDCREMGYPHMSISHPDSCLCREVDDLRDLYDVGYCNTTCWGTPCDSHQIGDEGDNTRTVYSTIDLTCPTIHINNSATSETVVMPGYLDDVTVATSLNIDCVTGYEFNEQKPFMTVITSLTTMCHNERTWYPDVSGLDCVKVNCSSPPSHSEATITDTNGTLYGDVATYSCGANPGIIFDGRLDSWTVSCGEDKQWTGPIPACSRRVCEPPPTVTLATANASSDATHVFGDSLLFTCEDGARFTDGNTTELSTTCLDSGQWSVLEPTCTRYRCPSTPPTVFNSMYSPNETHTTGMYTCLFDHTFSDRTSSSVVHCSNNTGLVWTQTPSNCIRSTSRDSPWALYSSRYRLTTDPVTTRTTRSVTGCALACLTDSRCLKFSHSDGGGMNNCVVSLNGDANVTSSRDGQFENGWDTYYMGLPPS